MRERVPGPGSSTPDAELVEEPGRSAPGFPHAGDRARPGDRRDVAAAAVCNAEWAHAERQVRDWAPRHGLVAGDEESRRLARTGHGRMAGWLAPGAGPAELALLAQWGAFIALVDDGFDRGGGSPREARTVLDQLLDVLGAPDGTRYPASAPPAVRALADLWDRTRTAARPGWRRRFHELYEDFADATVTELRLRAEGRHLELDDYLALRRRTITVLPVLAVVERGLPAADRLDGLREAAADIVAWTNDLRSAPRELEEGTENLVGVLARHHGCSPSRAASTARGMLARRMDDFDRAAHGDRAAPIRQVRDGSLAWQRETHRNPPGKGFSTAEHERGVPALARHLAVAVDAAGQVDDRCGSRVLESALLLSLLRKQDVEPGEQERLARFLRRRRPDASSVDALLIDACLDPARMADRAPERAARLPVTVSSGTAGRGRLKSVMLRTVLHLLCGSALEDGDAPAPVGPEGVTTFTDVHVLSARIVHAHARGRPHAVTGAERSRLLSLLSLGRDRVLWEASATTHLLGLHAVRTFRPDAQVLDDGLLRLFLSVNADDGVPFLDSQDLWLTAVAGLAFTGVDALAPYVPRMAALVADRHAADGGWPFATGMRQTDVDTTTRCMEFLHAAAPHRHGGALDRAAGYLTGIAGPDGGFPTWVRGDTADLDMTAGAVLALAPRAARHERLLTGALAFVLDAQHPDGTFERSWTVSESSAILRAVDALHAVPVASARLAARIAAATARSVTRLLATQHPDGGWGQLPDDPSDVLSTAQAVPVLARHGDPISVSRAVTYLLARQDADGGFTSPPDQVGPRPLPFDYPVLADLHTLSALRSARLPDDPATRTPVTLPGPSPASESPGKPRKPARTGVDWSALEAGLRGVLLRPEQAAYEQARLLVNQRFDGIRPQAIAYPADVHDVVECVNFARTSRVPLALRSGGHSYAGYSTGTGLVLDVGSLNSARVGDGRAVFGAGVKGGQAHLALAAAGAGLPLGRCPTIGVAGVTLGGGLSAFTRAWGLACDHLREAEIVTADGRVRRVRADSPPPDADLFWALCGGGGGNYGAVTALEFATEDIRDLSHTRFLVSWPTTATADVLRGWSLWNGDPATPRTVTCAFEQLSDGGVPSRPTVTGTFMGTPDALQPLLDRLAAAVGRPEADRLSTPCDYPRAACEADRWGSGTFGPRVAFAAKSHIVRSPLGPAAVTDLATALDALHRLPGVGGASGLLIDALGGAVGDRPANATAFPHRAAVGVVQYHSYWHEFTDGADVERRLAWLRDVHAVMEPHLGPGGYTNGMDPELTDWQTAYHGENYPRLQRVKAVCDPEELFTFPQAVTCRAGGR
ncbi:FAD-binding protein [Streptomyces parvulus]|uniref:terpene synthase family protein n=1 Tax=Streptomyces parvulus TaxID=146923 RepID=UPI0037FEBA24